jgi:AcrR family transcriptional regulator
MRKIARRIGYTPMTIYLYFKDKAELLDCLCEEAFEDLYRRHEHLDATVKEPVERLKAGMRTFVDFALKHPHLYRASFNFCAARVTGARDASGCALAPPHWSANRLPPF